MNMNDHTQLNCLFVIDFNEGVSHFKLSIWVPTEAVGKVIGKKGAVIQHIQRETKTTCSIISVPNGESESMDGPKWSPIVIMGDPTRALAAHDMIQDIVEGNNFRNVYYIVV